MSRRVLAALLTLTAALFAGICIPLGLDGTRHDRALFELRATTAVDAYAAEVKWRRLVPDAEPLPQRTSDEPGVDPDDLALFAPDGTPLAAAGRPIVVRPDEIDAAANGRITHEPSPANGRRLVVLSAVNNANGLVAVIAVARPDEAMRRSIHARWTRIGIGGGLTVLGALGLSFLLARWVNRPLRRLERAAADLGSGHLAARADDVGGPAEVRELARAFDAMAVRIESLVDGQRAFLADVSHQLRTPLAAMRLRLELLAFDVASATSAGGTTPKASAAVTTPETDAVTSVTETLVEVNRLSRMVDGLLAMARAEYAPQPRRPVNIATVAHDRVTVWLPAAMANDVNLLCGPTAGPGSTVWAELTPGHLEQVLDNLISNALEAARPGGTIAVRGEVGPPWTVRLTVTDDGPGMSEQARARAFRRFGSGNDHSAPITGVAAVPAPPSASDGSAAPVDGPGAPDGSAAPVDGLVRADRRGHGLGLAIVHALVTADAGSVRLAQAPGGGLRVVVDLPAAARSWARSDIPGGGSRRPS